MDATEYISLVTSSASSLLGNETLLLSNESQPMKMRCDEYVTYVDELLRSITQQVKMFLCFYYVMKHVFFLMKYFAISILCV